MPPREILDKMRVQLVQAEKARDLLRSEIALAKAAGVPIPDQEKSLATIEKQLFQLKVVYNL